MAFKRGHWRCGMVGCNEDATMSMVIVVSTPGARKERQQVYTPAVRLCTSDAKQIVKGKLPPALTIGIAEAIAKLSGEAWEQRQKRTK